MEHSFTPIIKEILSQMNINDFTKQDVINFANSSEIYKLYIKSQ